MNLAQKVSVNWKEPNYSKLKSEWRVKNWGYNKLRKPRSFTV